MAMSSAVAIPTVERPNRRKLSKLSRTKLPFQDRWKQSTWCSFKGSGPPCTYRQTLAGMVSVLLSFLISTLLRLFGYGLLGSGCLLIVDMYQWATCGTWYIRRQHWLIIQKLFLRAGYFPIFHLVPCRHPACAFQKPSVLLMCEWKQNISRTWPLCGHFYVLHRSQISQHCTFLGVTPKKVQLVGWVKTRFYNFVRM
jgi:hypothetical protein